MNKRRSVLAIVVAACLLTSIASAAGDEDWPVIGRQGIVKLILVPAAEATDRKAYDRQIDRLCETGQTCFLNFYTNSQGVALSVPLPDEITAEATATFRRSFKLGAQLFMWSCRLKASTDECF